MGVGRIWRLSIVRQRLLLLQLLLVVSGEEGFLPWELMVGGSFVLSWDASPTVRRGIWLIHHVIVLQGWILARRALCVSLRRRVRTDRLTIGGGRGEVLCACRRENICVV